MDSIDKTLADRQAQHGSFDKHCEIECKLQAIVDDCMAGKSLTDEQQVGLEMIIHKLARLLNNGHHHADTWHDIAGYATLVERAMLDYHKQFAAPVNDERDLGT